MHIYFCDSCGKRYTEEADPIPSATPGEIKKNLCPECAATTSTAAAAPIILPPKSPVPVRKPPSSGLPGAAPDGPITVLPAATKSRKSSARIPAIRPSSGPINPPVIAERQPSNANKFIYGGAGLAVLAISLVFVLSSSSKPTEEPKTVSAQPPPPPPPARPPEPPPKIEPPENKEERANTAFTELQIRIDAATKDDPGARQAIESFLREFAETSFAPRARELLEKLSAKTSTTTSATTVKTPSTSTSTGTSTATTLGTPEEQIKHLMAKLQVLNPGFDGKSTQRIVAGKIVSLTLNITSITSIGPVHDLPALEELILDSKTASKLTDLSPLSGIKLTHLVVTHAAIENLLPLNSLPLGNLDLSFNPISTLSGLKIPTLKDLTLSNTPISDLTPLQGMPQLSILRITATKVTDLSPLKGLPISQLAANHNNLQDLSGLQGLPLKVAILGDNPITDISPLHGLPLANLNLVSTKVTDLSPLTGTPLTILDISKTQVKELAPLKGLPLTQLNMSASAVEDLSPLEGATISKLVINGTGIHDLTQLKLLPSLTDVTCDMKTKEDVEALSSLLPKLKTLNGNPAHKAIKDWKPPKK